MELEQLRTFAAIARLGSLSAASGAVSLSQPAVSRQVQALERRLNARLLERGARGVRLTEAGEAAARAAADVLARLEELETEIARLGGAEGGPLRLGATVTVCLYLLPPLLGRYRERYPRQEIVRSEEHTSELQSRFGISYAVFCLKKMNSTAQAQRHHELERHAKGRFYTTHYEPRYSYRPYDRPYYYSRPYSTYFSFCY